MKQRRVLNVHDTVLVCRRTPINYMNSDGNIQRESGDAKHVLTKSASAFFILHFTLPLFRCLMESVSLQPLCDFWQPVGVALRKTSNTSYLRTILKYVASCFCVNRPPI